MVCLLTLFPDFLKIISFFFLAELMVPAAKKAHSPKYKLFGGMCYFILKATTTGFFSLFKKKNLPKKNFPPIASSLPPRFFCLRWSLHLGRSSP